MYSFDSACEDEKNVMTIIDKHQLTVIGLQAKQDISL